MLWPPAPFDSASLPPTLCIQKKPSTEEILQLSHTHNLGYLHSWANYSQVHQRGEFPNTNEYAATRIKPKTHTWQVKPKGLLHFQKEK